MLRILQSKQTEWIKFRITEWLRLKGPMEVICSTASAQAEIPRTSCPGPYTGIFIFWTSLRSFHTGQPIPVFSVSKAFWCLDWPLLCFSLCSLALGTGHYWYEPVLLACSLQVFLYIDISPEHLLNILRFLSVHLSSLIHGRRRQSAHTA